MTDRLIESVLKTTRNYSMLKPQDTVIAAVSGGPDSVFLLHALNKLKRKLGISKLIVCNLDHGLRGKASEEDSLFVKKLAREMDLKFIHKKVDLGKGASGKLSTEELGREARYKFFHDEARKSGANVIATGHTLDDQAETILMRIIKGASLKGIVGISPVREENGVRIIRPLMELEKSQIVEYCGEKGIAYRIDYTNLEPVYFRNVVRQEIMPFLEKYNPRLKRVLFNLAEHLREDYEFIVNEKSRAASLISTPRPGVVEISLKDMVMQPKALQKEILRDSLEKAGGVVKKLSFRHWKEMEGLVARKSKGSSVDLPGGIRIMRTGNALVFSKNI